MRNSRSRSGGVVSIDALESRQFLSVSPLANVQQQTVVIGIGGASGVTFLADNGYRSGFGVIASTATITFTGPLTPRTIQGHIYFPLTSVETVESIVFTDAVPGRAALRVQGSPFLPLFNVGAISGGDLSSINAPEINLVGSMHFTSLNTMILGAVSGAAMNLGTHGLDIKIRGIFTGSLTAGSLGKFSAFEMVKAAISTTAPFSRSRLQIGSIDGGAGIEQSEIISEGNIGSIRAKFIESSVITAATNAPAAPAGTFPVSQVPEFSDAFSAPASIHSIRIISAVGAGFFNNSIIAARAIGTLQLGQLGAATSGLAAHTFGAVSILSPAGSPDLISLRLGSDQLHSSARLAATLTARHIANQFGNMGPDNVLVFDLNWNVLR